MTIKVCLFGDSGSGKTSIIEKSLGHEIPIDHRPDIGYGATLIQNGDQAYDVWDCAGCESVGPGIDLWMCDLDMAIIVIDLGKPYPEVSVQHWLGPLQNLYPSTPIILCLNKIDIANEIPILDTDLPTILISAKIDLDLYLLWNLVQELILEDIAFPSPRTRRHKLKGNESSKE